MKRKRSSRVLEEKHILKSAAPIATPSLDTGGKLNPAKNSDGSFVDPEEEKKKTVEKKIEADPSRIFIYIRLPTAVRKKLTDLSRVIAKDFGGVDAEDVDHITLFFVRSNDGEFDKEQADNIRAVAQKVITEHLPLSGAFQGWAYFDQAEKGGEKTTALVALLDVPGLEGVFVALKDALASAGIDYEQKHSYVPHATLAYLPLGARVKTELPLLNDTVKITQAELAHEKEHVLKEALTPMSEPGTMGLDVLRKAHWNLHKIFRGATGEVVEGFSIQQLVNLHARIVDELYERNVLHPAPPDDGLDENSSSFESNTDGQPNWAVALQKSNFVSFNTEEPLDLDEREKAYLDASQEE